ncbi:renalase [Sphingomonas sp. SORGH_AS 950]|uniref:NAD(P)/FAD-dependent oxidoreductase n=1 Tax=Sphingomonas sp. SORGH_AS_0950 TaxID=3041792 RepID=UPI0027872726|nr:FAD-dependent oxidoreductase [Sphingomonas sp. SORGH_AS_0950]MDQ1157909.1 renalase [Sphingomonas sp. SORGH_AS_0950]
MATMRSMAIIGAGMAGLSCAARAAEAGCDVRLFDKGRRPGGRLSSKTVFAEGLDFAFDYGAQYLTARDPLFRAQVADWEKAGIVARWPAAGADAWVGTPAMATIPAHMAGAHQVRWSTHIRSVARDATGWTLVHDEGCEGPFDALVLAIPAEQVGPLIAAHDPGLAQRAAACPSAPCWTVMLGFDTRLSVADVPALRDPIDWAARNPAKPEHGGGEAWTIHATEDWSRRHLERDAASVTASLLRAFEEQTGSLPPPVHAAAHRWRYARSAKGGTGAHVRPDIALAACGDWLIAPRVESAWMSGRQAADGLSSG